MVFQKCTCPCKLYEPAKGIHETTEYLETFLRNLLLNEKNELHSRNLHISGLLNEGKVDIRDRKVDIENEKWTFKTKKWILKVYFPKKGSAFSVKTTVHIHRLFEEFGFDEVFGRSAVMKLLELKGKSGGSNFLQFGAGGEYLGPLYGVGGREKFI